MTINNDYVKIGVEILLFVDCNEYNLNKLIRINWRASLVPAASVIPAPRVYTKVVAVKKLVVYIRGFSDFYFPIKITFNSIMN